MRVSEKTIFNKYSQTSNNINLLTDSKVQYIPMLVLVFGPTLPWCVTSSNTLLFISLYWKSAAVFFPFIRTFSIQFICLKNAWVWRFFHIFRLWYRQLLLIIWTSFKPTAISGRVPLLTLAFGDCARSTSGSQNRTVLPKRHHSSLLISSLQK